MCSISVPGSTRCKVSHVFCLVLCSVGYLILEKSLNDSGPQFPNLQNVKVTQSFKLCLQSNMRSTLLANFWVYSTSLSTIGTMCSVVNYKHTRSLELFFLSFSSCITETLYLLKNNYFSQVMFKISSTSEFYFWQFHINVYINIII